MELNKNHIPTRYVLKDESKESMVQAFKLAEELNLGEEPRGNKITRWRVGKTTDAQLILDIDDADEKNLKQVVRNLKIVFPNENFLVIKTVHTNGYRFQIIGTEKFKAGFVYKHCKVLNVSIQRDYQKILAFKTEIINILNEYRKERNAEWNFNAVLEKSGLINPVGKFDYTYNVIAIEKERSSIRLTPKKVKDRWEVVHLNA